MSEGFWGAQQLEGAFREGEAFLGGMLPSLAEELLRGMPAELRRLFPPPDSRRAPAPARVCRLQAGHVKVLCG